MSDNANAVAKPIALYDLTALCDEIAALVRAGVPLETGLAQFAEDLPDQIGTTAGELVEHLQRGEDLPTALHALKGRFPDYFVSIVEAGCRSGRLGVAVEGMAATGRRMLEIRRSVVLAMFYPTLLLFLAYILFVFLVSRSAVVIGEFCDDVGLTKSWFTEFAIFFGGLPWYWLALIPLILLLLIVVWLWASGRARLLQSGRGCATLAWLPSARRVLRNSRLATFAEILSLLFEQQVPAPQALRLAGAASGDQQLEAAGDEMADTIEQGGDGAQAQGLPPVLRWLILSIHGTDHSLSPRVHVEAVRRVAENYRVEAIRQAEWLRISVPILATLLVGGGISLLYVLTALLPWWNILYEIGQTPGRLI